MKESKLVTSIDPSVRGKKNAATSFEKVLFDLQAEIQSSYSTVDEADLVCLSHLRWNFVYQRPQHLMSRFARKQRVFFIEEPLFSDHCNPHCELRSAPDGVVVAVPHLPTGLNPEECERMQKNLLDQVFEDHNIKNYILWFYTPMALGFASHLNPLVTIYDCMDELSAFKGAPPALQLRELDLFSRADVVFTGGQSLFEAKCKQHENVHAVPSSVDAHHFGQARRMMVEPADQVSIPQPRIGFFGVLDERLDLELIEQTARLKPDWHFVFLGPVVKINFHQLPQLPNIHFLGSKSYQELPCYLAGWEVAILPFARNESTRFISPTKTPEYLAAGKPVVSTSIRDVIRPYADRQLVQIADTPKDFVNAIAGFLSLDFDRANWLTEVDAFLAQMSWDLSWQNMRTLLSEAVDQRKEIWVVHQKSS